MKEPLEPGSPAMQGFPRFLRVGHHAERSQSPNFRTTGHPIMPHSTNSASLDVMLDILRNSHRRRILLAVSDHNPRDEDEFTPDDVAADNDDLERLKTQLQHTHLPKLAEKGYIEWNPDTETIRRGPNFEEIAPLLTLMMDHADELPNDWP